MTLEIQASAGPLELLANDSRQPENRPFSSAPESWKAEASHAASLAVGSLAA